MDSKLLLFTIGIALTALSMLFYIELINEHTIKLNETVDQEKQLTWFILVCGLTLMIFSIF